MIILKLKKTNFINIKALFWKKLLFSKKDFKYFTGYKNATKIRPLCIFLPKMRIYKRGFVKTKCMRFLIKDETFFDKYTEIWEKVSNIIKKGNFRHHQ